MAPSIEFDKQYEPRVESLLKAAQIPYLIPSRESVKSKYIELPESGLIVPKERTLFNKRFYEQQEILHRDNSKMLTLNEFREFLKVAKKEDLELYNEITQVKSPWRAEYLDADFKVEGENLVMFYHSFETGNIVLKKEIIDRDTLMKDKTPGISLDNWLENSTVQGLPSKKIDSGDLYYWAPTKDNNSVAGFGVFVGRAFLDCNWYPSNRISGLGVRAAKQRE